MAMMIMMMMMVIDDDDNRNDNVMMRLIIIIIIIIINTLKKWVPLSHTDNLVNFDVLLTVHLSIFTSVFNQLHAQNVFQNKFYFMPVHVSSTCAHHQEVKIVLHSLWYHHTYRWPSRARDGQLWVK